jgi:hypothetical protein
MPAPKPDAAAGIASFSIPSDSVAESRTDSAQFIPEPKSSFARPAATSPGT